MRSYSAPLAVLKPFSVQEAPFGNAARSGLDGGSILRSGKLIAAPVPVLCPAVALLPDPAVGLVCAVGLGVPLLGVDECVIGVAGTSCPLFLAPRRIGHVAQNDCFDSPFWFLEYSYLPACQWMGGFHLCA